MNTPPSSSPPPLRSSAEQLVGDPGVRRSVSARRTLVDGELRAATLTVEDGRISAIGPYDAGAELALTDSS